jgi:AcrR family transcriptional regulator
MPESKDKRAVILDTTLRLIVARGLESTPMSLIASEAGVGMGTIYHHFPSKEELVNVLYRELKVEVNRAMLSGYSREAPIRERFFRIWRNLFHVYLQYPEMFQFLEQYSYSPYITLETKDIGTKLWEEPIRLMEEGQEQQIVKDLPIKLIMLIAGAPLINLVKEAIGGHIALNDAMIEAAITACWDAVKR